MDINDIYNRFASAKTFDGKSVIGQITEIASEKLTGRDGVTKPKILIRVAGFDKLIVVNKTNAMAIAQSFGPESDRWVGREVKVSSVPVQAFGQIIKGFKLEPVVRESEIPF